MDLQSIFTANRSRLLSIAYRMLGSASSAEDVVQEAWLRVRDSDPQSLRAPAALLRTVVVRLCLDELKSARQNRETYVGPWLPEPVRAEPDDQLADSRIDEFESLSMAFLLILETLSPLERAAFLLRQVFEYDFDEIAASLGRTPAACRQLCHRAQEHVSARQKRYHVEKAQHLQILQAFVNATSSGDVAQLSRLLCADVVATSDANGETVAARKEVTGRDRVSRFLVGVAKKGGAHAQLEPAWVNGCPALLGSVGGQLRIAMILENNGEQVTAIRLVLANQKLRWLRRQGEAIH